jgi:hypothetical protein
MPFDVYVLKSYLQNKADFSESPQKEVYAEILKFCMDMERPDQYHQYLKSHNKEI